jgi:hypothetical protein
MPAFLAWFAEIARRHESLWRPLKSYAAHGDLWVKNRHVGTGATRVSHARERMSVDRLMAGAG